MIRIKIGPTREEASRNSAPDVQWTPGVQDKEVHLRLYICMLHYGSSHTGHIGSSFYVSEVHCTWHSGCSICTSGVPCCSSISTLFYLLWLNVVLLQWRNRKLWHCLPSTSLGLKCTCAYLAHISGDTVPLTQFFTIIWKKILNATHHLCPVNIL